MWRKIGVLLLLLLLATVAGGLYYTARLGGTIKAALEDDGSAATQTAVRAGGVLVFPIAGLGEITTLSVANPPGYSTPTAVALDRVAVQLDILSLVGNGPLVAKNVAITQPRITYELKLDGLRSNLQTIQSNIADYAGSGPAANGLLARKQIIRELSITGGQVSVIAPVLHGKILVVALPPLHFTDLGGSDGAPPAQLAAQVLNVMTRQAIITGAAALAKQVGTGIPAEAGALLKSLFGN